MKRILMILVIALGFVSSAFAFIDEYTISRDKLPEEAQTMLNTYFPKAKIGMIKIDRHLLKKPDYEVRLTNGTTIEFRNNGKWKEVDCKSRPVPEGLIPKTILRHVKKNYEDVTIVKIEKKSSGYILELSDDVELKYDHLGIFKGAKIDDDD